MYQSTRTGEQLLQELMSGTYGPHVTQRIYGDLLANAGITPTANPNYRPLNSDENPNEAQSPIYDEATMAQLQELLSGSQLGYRGSLGGENPLTHGLDLNRGGNTVAQGQYQADPRHWIETFVPLALGSILGAGAFQALGGALPTFGAGGAGGGAVATPVAGGSAIGTPLSALAADGFSLPVMGGGGMPGLMELMPAGMTGNIPQGGGLGSFLNNLLNGGGNRGGGGLLTNLFTGGGGGGGLLGQLLGAGLGAYVGGSDDTVTQQNRMDPRMDQYVYGSGHGDPNSALGMAMQLFRQNPTGINPVMQQGLDMMQQTYSDPAYRQAYQGLAGLGQGLLNMPVAGNPFMRG
jgi:hypothetical protein